MGFLFLLAGIFNSRIGSILGSELWRAGWLGGLFIIVVGPGGRISTVDCSRVLNVNRSVYSSTSPGRAQRVVLRAQRTHSVRGPDLYYWRGSRLRLIFEIIEIGNSSELFES